MDSSPVEFWSQKDDKGQSSTSVSGGFKWGTLVSYMVAQSYFKTKPSHSKPEEMADITDPTHPLPSLPVLLPWKQEFAPGTN